MGSDGLFDNVFDHEIVNIVTKHTDVAESCMHIITKSCIQVYNLKFRSDFGLGATITARLLAEVASNHSRDPGFESPYALEARAKVDFNQTDNVFSGLPSDSQVHRGLMFLSGRKRWE